MKKIAKKKKPITVMKKASRKINPKCKTKSHKMFRSAVLRPRGKTFRDKEPIPDQRIYKDRTLEVGIVVDKMLFLKMKVCKFGL